MSTLSGEFQQPRLRGEGTHYVHAISRVIERRFIFADEEKEYFHRLMRKLEHFTGLRIVTYCLMSNHVHILIEQPDRDQLPALTIDELLRRMKILYDPFTINDVAQEFARAEAAGDLHWQQRILDRYAHRMGDVSKFMQELKQRFSQWFNRRNNRRGPLWEGRYKSVLVEADEEALMTMAAYIDLNPVRAGMVSSPEDYRWCGYGAAMSGDKQARAGLGRILDYSPRICGSDFESRWCETGKLYRWWLYQEGEEVTADPDMGKSGRKGFSRAEVEKVSAKEGRISLSEKLNYRVRCLTSGAVLGSAAFVDQIFAKNRQHFGKRRQSGARKMRGDHWGNLRVLRDLQIE
ncbi:MAG: transposase [Verrucomicrobiales bacterium]|nr:transposase [Verrucomicrobiales bacterium]